MRSSLGTCATRIARGVGNLRAIAGLLVAALVLLITFSPALASETITYTYDALGRLVNVNHGTTGPNAGAVSSYTYDKADNRQNVTVATGTATLTLSPASLPNGTVGTAYSQTIAASGGTGTGYSYSVSSGTLPTGLTLSSGGVLSGTPSATGTKARRSPATSGAS